MPYDCSQAPVEPTSIAGGPAAPPATRQATTSLLIEGWRGVNHSYALVNQHQILELLKLDGLHLFHRDLPFVFPHWNRASNDAGFAAVDRQRIDSLPEPADSPIDCVYRICSPFRPGPAGDQRRTLTFMITEIGLARGSFEAGSERSDFFTRDGNLIVTSTDWSRARLVDHGFAAEKVVVIPLGVDTATFRPVTAIERATNRANLGIADDETVFLNIGVAVWNKGIDALLRAFARLRGQGRRVRLILKDQRDVYGISVEQTIRNTGEQWPVLLRAETLAAISVIPGNLDRQQLRLLYGIADAYVSPYRAEGFNLPVLEAIACATPVIVTRGGATDDFCTDEVAFRIGGRAGRHENASTGLVGRFIEPDADELLAAMEGLAIGRHLDAARAAEARARIVQDFSWPRAARELAALVTGQPTAARAAAPQPAAPVTVRTGRVTQQEVLELIAMVRPRALSRTHKVRIGNNYDGGYVLPAIALDCDAVLSIGVGSDVSFDIDLAERGARVLQFDNTVEQSPVSHRNFTFYKLGWGIRSEGDLLGFDDIHAKLAALGTRQPLLKFDIEGAEYEVLETTEPRHLAEFAVIACEIHDLGRLTDPVFFDRVRRCFKKLTLHHAPVHLHANNYRGVVLVEGVPIPDVLEISFLRRDLDDLTALSPEPIPGPLDRPNHPFVPDICMNAF
jgi:glycosyltransferase involved in cell wall biosynthesis